MIGIVGRRQHVDVADEAGLGGADGADEGRGQGARGERSEVRIAHSSMSWMRLK